MLDYEYDAWGRVISVKDASGNVNTDASFIGNINPFRYRSYYYDTETGLYYLNSRYYDPETGRFINADDVQYLDPETLGGLSLYAYCLNNPVMCSLGCKLKRSASAPVVKSHSVYSNVSSVGKSVANWSVHKTTASYTQSGNIVSMINYSTTLVDNVLFGMVLGNISITNTTQLDDSGTFYLYSNVGNSTSSIGAGLNVGNWYGLNVYLSSNIGIGYSVQIASYSTYGVELSVLDGISFSFGSVSGNETNEITVSIGWGTLAFAYATCGGLATIPIPGARVLAGVALCTVLLIDIFN